MCGDASKLHHRLQDGTHILNGAGTDGDKHVGQVEKEVAAHHRPLHLAVRLVPLQVQCHPLKRSDGGSDIKGSLNLSDCEALSIVTVQHKKQNKEREGKAGTPRNANKNYFSIYTSIPP